MLNLTKVITPIALIVAQAEMVTIDDVILSYIEKPHYTSEDVPVTINSVYIIEYDIDRDNDLDLWVSSPEKYYSEQHRDFLRWRVCLRNSKSKYVWHNVGVTCPLNDLVMVKDNEEKARLGYIRWYPEGRGVMPLEVDARGAMTTEGIRFIDESSTEDLEWLEEGRKAAQGLIRTYTPEDIAALRAARDNASLQEDAIADESVDDKSVPDESVIEATPPVEGVGRESASSVSALETHEHNGSVIPPQETETPAPWSTLFLVAIGAVVLICLATVAYSLVRGKRP